MRKENKYFRFLTCSIISLALCYPVQKIYGEKAKNPFPFKSSILELLKIKPSDESIDYVQNKTQFQLHTLLTEQRHLKTWDLSQRIQKDYQAGLQMLFAVDDDIEKKLELLIQKRQSLDQAVLAMEKAILKGNKIYIYGCGATGRLAKQMESTFWRPFWKKVKNHKKIWVKVKNNIGPTIEERLIGEMTGADRALISSLEGFEDLLLIGHLQLHDRGIKKGDVVLCVTEGGETSSVIGTILSALKQWKKSDDWKPENSKKNLYFIYNNPDERLYPFERSRIVLEEPGITKINLTTGSQSITGSTRMQATTIETFVVGHMLQAAISKTLQSFLTQKEMSKLGFSDEVRLENKFAGFSEILKEVKNKLPSIASFTELETTTYKNNHFSTYFADKGLITVFIDSTERSPTFRLYPLDTIKEKKRKCWIQVWTPSSNQIDAWNKFLGRPFRGLSRKFYQKPFSEKITDTYLKKAALDSLKNAGNDQQNLYDFSFSDFNLKNRTPAPGDLGVCVALGQEENLLGNKKSAVNRFLKLFSNNNGKIAFISVSEASEKKIKKLVNKISKKYPDTIHCFIHLNIPAINDPLEVDRQIALKILLNAHSTAVMARLGKVIGNTMTNVSPSNLKLIGRATYLIQSHVNDILKNRMWVKKNGNQKPVTYGEANAVLYDTIYFLRKQKTKAGQTAEVALSIIRILETFQTQAGGTPEESFNIVKSVGLAQYLKGLTS